MTWPVKLWLALAVAFVLLRVASECSKGGCELPTGIIERITVPRARVGEAARMQVLVSFTLRDAGEMLPKLANQIGLGVDVAFSNFQMALPEGETGEPGVPAHKYQPGPLGFCDFCGASETSAIHNEIELERVEMTVDGEEAEVVREPLSPAAQALVDETDAGRQRELWGRTPHAFEPNERDNQCGRCALGQENEIHNTSGHLSVEAQEARARLARRRSR